MEKHKSLSKPKIIIIVSIIILIILCAGFGLLYSENFIFLNVLTVYKSTSYIAEYSNEKIFLYFWVIDSTNYMENLNIETAEFNIYSTSEIKSVNFESVFQLKESSFLSPYNIYRVDVSLQTSENEGITTFDSFSIDDKMFNIGSITIETCGEIPQEIFSCNSYVYEYFDNYSIPNIKNLSEDYGEIVSISYVFGENIYEFLDKPIALYPKTNEIELTFDTENFAGQNVVIRPKITFVSNGKTYYFMPLTSTSYKTELSKEDIISFLRDDGENNG